MGKKRTALEAVRTYCLTCMNDQPSLVRECADTSCPLYPLRMKEPADIRPVRAIRRFCMVCLVGDRKEIRQCTENTTCPLWPYRFGVSLRTLKSWRRRHPRQKQRSLPGLE